MGEEDPSTLLTMCSVGRLLLAQGKPDEAIGLLAPTDAAARKAFTGRNDIALARWLTVLGRARAATGDFVTAESNLTEAHTIIDTANNATNRDRRDVSTGLMNLYDAWLKAEPDKGHDAKAAEWRAKLVQSQEQKN